MAYIEIDKTNYFYNLNQLALKAGSKEQLAVVLKDNAYGHGLEIIAKLASEFGIKEAVVIDTQEADRIKKYFKNILILNDTPLPIDGFSYAVTSLKALKECHIDSYIELKVDTGMHRNGIALDEFQEAIAIIKSRRLNLKGIMTHYRSADILSSEYFWQKKRFEQLRRDIIAIGFRDIRFHSHNSAALLRCNNFDEDIARVGIASYGCIDMPQILSSIKLKPVMSLWANRVNSRILKAGERVGYGGDFIADRDMIISTYDIGYGDGWFRGDSANPYKTAEGLEILGRVSMDFITLEGDRDRVCIMQDANKASKHFNTISYEITTALSPHLQRIII